MNREQIINELKKFQYFRIGVITLGDGAARVFLATHTTYST